MGHGDNGLRFPLVTVGNRNRRFLKSLRFRSFQTLPYSEPYLRFRSFQTLPYSELYLRLALKPKGTAGLPVGLRVALV